MNVLVPLDASKRERVSFIERYRRGHLQYQARGSRWALLYYHITSTHTYTDTLIHTNAWRGSAKVVVIDAEGVVVEELLRRGVA